MRPVRRGGSRRCRTCLRRASTDRSSVPARDPWSGSRDSNTVYLVPGQARSPLHHIPVGLDGFELLASRSPSIRATCRATPVTSGSPESNRVSPESGSGRLPSSSIPQKPVEKVGIEPTTTTLARRARYLSCHPRGTGEIRTRGLLHAMQTLYRSELQPHGRRSDATAAITAGVTCRYGAHAMDVSIGQHVHPQVVLRRDAAGRTPIPPVLETGRLSAGSSLCN